MKYKVVINHSKTITVRVEADSTFKAIEKAKRLTLSNNAAPDLETYKTEIKSIEEIE